MMSWNYMSLTCSKFSVDSLAGWSRTEHPGSICFFHSGSLLIRCLCCWWLAVWGIVFVFDSCVYHVVNIFCFLMHFKIVSYVTQIAIHSDLMLRVLLIWQRWIRLWKMYLAVCSLIIISNNLWGQVNRHTICLRMELRHLQYWFFISFRC